MIKIITQLILKLLFISIFFSSCNNANTDEIKNHDNLFISSITPTNGSSVGKSPTISITFSEEIDTATANNSTIKITNSSGTQIGGTLATTDDKIFDYSLSSQLEEDTYTITFTKNIKTESNKTIAKEYKSNFIVSYTNDKWTQATSSAGWSARNEHTSVVFNNKMWVIGGTTNDENVLSDVWSSSDGVNWTRTSTSGPARRQAQSLVYNNKIWVFGGANSDYIRGNVYSSSDGITWNEVLPHDNSNSTTRTSATAVVYDNKMWLIGGWNGSNTSNQYHYSTNGTSWTTITQAYWSSRYHHMSVVFDNKIWIFGGNSGGGSSSSNYNDVWYTSNGSSWISVNSSAPWKKRWGSGSVTDGVKMWLFGGNNDQNMFYSKDGVTWKNINVSVPTNSQTRWGFSSIFFKNKIWILGGHDNTGNFNDVWYW